MSTPLTKNDIIENLKEKEKLLREKFHVKRIGIFGSFARNENSDKSDIDFLVEFDIPLESYIQNRLNLIEYLEKLFGRKIDLANPNSLKPLYKNTILNQALYA
jgi:predicted nucleotidyltransferase